MIDLGLQTLVDDEAQTLTYASAYSSHLNDSGISPTGYRVLVYIPEKDEKTKGGIFLPQDVKRQEEIASHVGYVLQLGPLSYKDSSKFPDGQPWCRPGDYVVMAAYAGIRMRVPGDSREFRIINDDNVCAVVPNADGVERA